MKNFKTDSSFVITAGKRNRRIGTARSIEQAEFHGERLRKGTDYTIWKRGDTTSAFFPYRERIAG